MSNAKEINDANFEQEIINDGSLALVDFWAPWCGPCRQMSPVIDQISTEFEGKIKVVKINTDENTKTAQQYKISGLPSFVLFKDGEAKEILVGMRPKSALVSAIEKYL